MTLESTEMELNMRNTNIALAGLAMTLAVTIGGMSFAFGEQSGRMNATDAELSQMVSTNQRQWDRITNTDVKLAKISNTLARLQGQSEAIYELLKAKEANDG